MVRPKTRGLPADRGLAVRQHIGKVQKESVAPDPIVGPLDQGAQVVAVNPAPIEQADGLGDVDVVIAPVERDRSSIPRPAFTPLLPGRSLATWVNESW